MQSSIPEIIVSTGTYDDEIEKTVKILDSSKKIYHSALYQFIQHQCIMLFMNKYLKSLTKSVGFRIIQRLRKMGSFCQLRHYCMTLVILRGISLIDKNKTKDGVVSLDTNESKNS